MNKRMFLLILFFAFLPFAAFASPTTEPVGPVKPGSEYWIVGFTTTTTSGSISHPDGSFGYLAMTRYCQGEVAPDEHACITSEVSKPADRECIKEEQVEEKYCLEYATKLGNCKEFKTFSKSVCVEYAD